MNRAKIIAFLTISLFVCSSFVAATLAQTPTPAPPPPENPFAPKPAPPLPAGMTGADANDPRAKLTPGMYNAGESAMGIKHVLLLKKPEAFQISNDPSDPKVDKGA